MPPPYCYDHPRPAVTVDTVAFAFDGAELRVLMVRRGQEPYQGHWALPGGFIDLDEPADAAARRELGEETGIEIGPDSPFEPLGFYDAPGRDPRGRTISLVFVTAVSPPLPDPTSGSDASEAAWVPPDPEAQPLAFDHATILADARAWLVDSVENGPSGLVLLPDPFDRDDVRALFRVVGLSNRHITGWLNTWVKSERIEAVEGAALRYRTVTES